MGAFAAAVYRNQQEAEDTVAEMLRALRHRGNETRISTTRANSRAISIGFLSYADISNHFLENEGSTIAVEGSFFGLNNPVQVVRRNLGREKTLLKTVARTLMRTPGGFVAAFNDRGGLHILRDPNGLKSAYFVVEKDRAIASSERKALWRVGAGEPQRILPGYLYRFDAGKARRILAHKFRLPRPVRMTMQEASRRLLQLLKSSSRRITRNMSNVGVAFSGGLDSAVTAALAKRTAEPHLFSVGLAGSPEFPQVESYARELQLPITTQEYRESSLEDYVRRIIWLIEEPSLMKVSVAIPLHWTAMLASKSNTSILLCGQGSDELYGGYAKYARILDASGSRALASELFRSVVNSHEVNYERDDQATAPSGVELRTPFADLQVIEYSLMIPTEFKVKPGNDTVRKHVLRKSAELLRVPENIAGRRKKAIQHGTGVENAIRRLAKQRNLHVDEYLTTIHAEVIKRDSMP